MTDRLFETDAPTLAEVRKMSPDRRRTEQNRQYLKMGIHPITRRKLLEPEDKTCGDCSHHVVREAANRYHKCDFNQSSGAGTDLRISWPACVLFEEDA